MTKRGRRITRSVILFCAGLTGIGLETVYSLRYQQKPDSVLVLLFASMIGLPFYINQDSKGRKDDDDPEGRPGHGTG